MKCFPPVAPALVVSLILVAGPDRADIHSPPPGPLLGTPAQAPARPAPRFTLPPGLTLPRVPPPSAFFGTRIPKSYLIYGLKTGPGGMACTDRNGQVIPMPFNPHIIMGPEQSLPRTYALPRRAPLPAPKKLPRK